jgi:hypothetical protein
MVGLTTTTISQLEQLELRETALVTSAKKLFSQIEKHAAGGECHAGTAPSALWLISALGNLTEQQPEMNVQTVLYLAAEAMPRATEMYAACAPARQVQAGTFPPPSSCETVYEEVAQHYRCPQVVILRSGSRPANSGGCLGTGCMGWVVVEWVGRCAICGREHLAGVNKICCGQPVSEINRGRCGVVNRSGTSA